jgi:hypothetical protein
MASEFYPKDGPLSNAWNLAAVTPHDTNELTYTARALYIGGAGDVALIAGGDSAAVTLASVPAGTILPIRAKVVKSTGTTATNIVALY